MKTPDHPVPSGDREIARLLLAALAAAGCEAAIASRLRCRIASPTPRALAEIEREGARETERILAAIRAGAAPRPDVWLAYHVYYRSPDPVGPAVAAALGVPYVVVEGSWAARRDLDAFAPFQAHAAAALRRAAAVLCFSGQDRAGLLALGLPEARLVDLPPFLDAPPARPRRPWSGGCVELLAIAMMREGRKLASYAFLADALRDAAGAPWRLTLAGDGPARAGVERLFAGFAPGRVIFAGELDREAIGEALAASDLFVWPGLNESIGMVYLEAQAAGLPVVALDSGGVAATLRAGETGVLVAPVDRAAYAREIRRLIADAPTRERLGAAGARFVREERSVASAGAILRRTFARLAREGQGA